MEVNKNFFTKSDALVLYGIAAFIMVFHHIIGFPDKMHFGYTWTIDVFVKDNSIEWYIGRFFKTCVGIYAFISGYGLSQIAKKCVVDLKTNYKSTFKRMLKIYTMFWLVYITFIPLGLYMGYIHPSYKDLMYSFFGWDEKIIYEWWYINTYLILLLLFPIYDYLLNKYDRVCLTRKKQIIGWIIGIGLLFFVYRATHANVYMIIFVWGILFARYNWFDKINNTLLKKINRVYVALSAIIIAFALRNIYSARIDMVIIPIFIYGLIILIHEERLAGVRNFFSYLGKYSMYIWLVHAFFTYYYFQNLALYPRYSILICIWVLALSLMVSIILNKIFIYIKRRIE